MQVTWKTISQGALLVPLTIGVAERNIAAVPGSEIIYSTTSDHLSPSSYRAESLGATGPLKFGEKKRETPLTSHDERRFSKLAVKFALGAIDSAEKKEMIELDKRRSLDKRSNPRAIEAREKLFQKMDHLLGVLERV